MLIVFLIRHAHRHGDVNGAADKLDAALCFFTNTLKTDKTQNNYRTAARLINMLQALQKEENALPRCMEFLNRKLEILERVINLEPNHAGLIRSKECFLKNLAYAKERTERIEAGIALLKTSEMLGNIAQEELPELKQLVQVNYNENHY